MAEITTETTVKQTELAAVLGITARHVRKLTEDGILVKASGTYNLADGVQAYIRSVRGNSTRESDAATERKRRKAEADLKESKAVIEKLKAEELKSKMHRQEDVKVLMDDMVFAVRAALLALPGRLAVDTAAAGSPAEASDIIRREVHKIMQELAGYRYDPARFEERVRERMQWELNDEQDDEQ